MDLQDTELRIYLNEISTWSFLLSQQREIPGIRISKPDKASLVFTAFHNTCIKLTRGLRKLTEVLECVLKSDFYSYTSATDRCQC